MNLLTARHPSARQDAPGSDAAEPASRPPAARSVDQVVSSLLTRAVTVALWGCLLAGPVGLVVGLLGLLDTPVPVPAPARPPDRTEEPAVAGEFAQRLVITWLTTTRDDPAPLAGLVPDGAVSALPVTPYTVTAPTVARINSQDGVWSVTVAATVTDARGQTARRFYQVPVTVTGSTVTALTLPAPVAGPVVSRQARVAYRTPVDVSGPVGRTVVDFLRAYTAGQGDVTRYLTPGERLQAIVPPVFTAVTVTELRAAGDVDPTVPGRDGQMLRVLAAGTGTVTKDQTSPVAYTLTLTARAGRWEITAVDPAPARPGSSAPTTPTTAR